MYILIFENGEVKKTATINSNDMIAVDDGILDIIDISGDEPKTYYNGVWHDLESVDTW